MRPQALLKAGFYPTPPAIGRDIAKAFIRPRSDSPAWVLDPCAGEGAVLRQMAKFSELDCQGIELHSERASYHPDTAQGDAFHFSGAGFGVLFLNPPYDQINGERLETQFLRHWLSALTAGGWLVYIVPEYILEEVQPLLTASFNKLSIFRFPDEHYQAYKQVVVFGQRKGPNDHSQSTWPTVRPWPNGKGQALPLMSVPASIGQIFNSQTPVKEQLAEASQGKLWLELWEQLKVRDFAVQPLDELNQGHLALLLGAGALNGEVVEHNGERLVLRGYTRRFETLTYISTPSGKVETTIAKEHFQNEMAALSLASGELHYIGQASEARPTLMDSGDFFALHGPTLLSQARQRYQVANVPVTLAAVKRPAISGQNSKIAAVTRGLKSRRCTYLVAEQGSGKSYMGSVAAASSRAKRVLVLCPPHLVKKWQREVESSVHQKAHIIGSLADLKAHQDKAGFFILSRERAKLGSGWRAATMTRHINKQAVPCCPRCGRAVLDKDKVPVEASVLAKNKTKCRHCQEPLWQVTPSPRRVALGDYIKRQLPKNHFDLLVLDEFHEYKSGRSAQGIMAGVLASCARRTLALTGTLFGGYASGLFYLLWRFEPTIRAEFGLGDEQRFVERYGLVERVFKGEARLGADGRVSRRRGEEQRCKEKPGIDPRLLEVLLPCAVFLRLSELEANMPTFREHVFISEMDSDQAKDHLEYAGTVINAVRDALKRKDRRYLGLLPSLLYQPDTPYLEEIAQAPENNDGSPGLVIARTPALDASRVFPKERDLIKFCLDRKAAGRKVLM
jgi:hypothetical protein